MKTKAASKLNLSIFVLVLVEKMYFKGLLIKPKILAFILPSKN